MILLQLSFLSHLSCAYRFSKTRLVIPKNQRSIAVEAIYDVGENVIPHELLWESLQREIAWSGKFLLRSRNTADLYLRALVSRSGSHQFESTASSTIRDPNVFIDPDTNLPRDPAKYLDLRSASVFSKRKRISVSIEVEIWDLHTRKKIFAKSYDLKQTLNMFSGRSTNESRFIRHEEDLEYSYQALFSRVAKQITADFQSAYVLFY